MSRLSLIAAVARDGVIGKGNTLPWHIPEDLKRFKQITTGSPVILGRKTYESIGRLLPGRKNIIVSRSKERLVPGARVVDSLEAAIEEAKVGTPAEIFVLGGGEIYRLALPLADRLYITEIDLEVEGGDAWFPEWPAVRQGPVSSGSSRMLFRETSHEERPPSEDGKTPAFRFLVFDRIR
jgi:dihydrofolate reductase